MEGKATVLLVLVMEEEMDGWLELLTIRRN